MKNMDFSEWKAIYRPRVFKSHKEPELMTMMLEPNYLSDVETLKQYDGCYIWTYLSTSDGDVIAPGYRFVDRLGYLVTELPWIISDLFVDMETKPEKQTKTKIFNENCPKCESLMEHDGDVGFYIHNKTGIHISLHFDCSNCSYGLTLYVPETTKYFIEEDS